METNRDESVVGAETESGTAVALAPTIAITANGRTAKT